MFEFIIEGDIFILLFILVFGFGENVVKWIVEVCDDGLFLLKEDLNKKVGLF